MDDIHAYLYHFFTPTFLEVMQPFHTPPRKGPEPKNMVKYHIIKLSTP